MSYLYTDNQYNMKKSLLSLFACLLIQIVGYTQDTTVVKSDTINQLIDTTGLLAVKNSPVLQRILSNNEAPVILRGTSQSFIHFDHPVLGIREQVLLKTPKHLFIAISGSGRLYEKAFGNDSLLYFKRIDDNDNINYNLGAFWFINGENLYNYGGYGFWKSNGTIRGFNFKDHEWDVIPTNIEVFAPSFPISSWHDPVKNLLFVPYQQIINSGIKGFQNSNGKIEDGIMCLDFKSGNWLQLGKLLPSYLNIIKNAKLKVYTSTGYMISDGEDTYAFNFLNNSVSKNSNRSLAQSLIRIDYSSTHYYKDGLLYSYNPATGGLDTLVIDESKFVKELDPLWVIQFDYTKLWPLVLAGVLLIFMLVLIFVSNTSTTKAIETSNNLPGVKKIDVSFNQTELALIDLLIEKSIGGTTATISDINYVLGIKDKNLGMQKKVRSDVINGINDKFKYATNQDTQLVMSVRSETDKRYFEYFISKEQLREVQKLING